MEQVINNLIGNAIKYCQQRDRIEVEMSSIETEVVFRVADNGPGIAEENLARLFNPFERVPTSGSKTEKSSGLGLAIVQKIVAAHGGRAWVESRLDHGSTFFTALPLIHKETC